MGILARAYASFCSVRPYFVSPGRNWCSILYVRTYAKACFKTKPRKLLIEHKVSPLKAKIASEVRNIFLNEAVAVVHYGDLNAQSWNHLRLKLSEFGIKAKVIPTKLSTKALEDTPFVNIAKLFNGSTALLYGNMQQTNNLLSCIEAEPKLCLLGGKFLHELFTPEGLKNVAELPSVEVLQQGLLSILMLPQKQHLFHLQSIPNALYTSLKLHSSADCH